MKLPNRIAFKLLFSFVFISACICGLMIIKNQRKPERHVQLTTQDANTTTENTEQMHKDRQNNELVQTSEFTALLSRPFNDISAVAGLEENLFTSIESNIHISNLTEEQLIIEIHVIADFFRKNSVVENLNGNLYSEAQRKQVERKITELNELRLALASRIYGKAEAEIEALEADFENGYISKPDINNVAFLLNQIDEQYQQEISEIEFVKNQKLSVLEALEQAELEEEKALGIIPN